LRATPASSPFAFGELSQIHEAKQQPNCGRSGVTRYI
jgi:hypothetical protein